MAITLERRWVDTGRRALLVAPVGLLSAVVVGAVLRLVLLGSDSVWLDEAVSVDIAHEGPLGIARRAADETHPPLYYTLLHFWMAVFGDSETAVRALSAAIGTTIVPVAFALGRELAGGAAGVGAAVLVAVSPIQVQYAQEARMYALLALTSGISFLALSRILRAPSKAWVVLYAAATAAMLYSHVYGLFLLAAQAAFVAVLWFAREPERRPRGRPLAVGFGTALALYAPWTVALYQQVSREVQGEDANLAWLDAPGAGDVWDTVVHWAGSEGGALALCTLAVAAAGTMLMTRVRSGSSRLSAGALAGDETVVLLVLWTTVPLVLPFIVSHVTPVHVFLSRYTVSSALALAVLAAVLASRLPRPLDRVAAASVFATLAAGTALYHATYTKTDWRSASAYLEARLTAADLIVLDRPFSTYPLRYYFSPPESQLEPQDVQVTEARARAVEERGGTVWYMRTSPDEPTAAYDVLRQVDGEPRKVTFPRLELQVFGGPT